jgi:hypothetical protein
LPPSRYSTIDEINYGSNYSQQHRTDEKVILAGRITINTLTFYYGAQAAFSYSGPMLRRIQINLAEKALGQRAVVNYLAVKAELWALRVGLLRTVAWLSGAGWALTIGEIIYRIYLGCQPAKMTIWCQRCVFRQPALKGAPYSTAEEEDEEHAEALGLREA